MAGERRAHGPKELVLLRRVVKLDAMRAFSETSLWNANTWGRVGTCMGTIVRSCVTIHTVEFYIFHGYGGTPPTIFLLEQFHFINLQLRLVSFIPIFRPIPYLAGIKRAFP